MFIITLFKSFLPLPSEPFGADSYNRWHIVADLFGSSFSATSIVGSADDEPLAGRLPLGVSHWLPHRSFAPEFWQSYVSAISIPIPTVPVPCCTFDISHCTVELVHERYMHLAWGTTNVSTAIRNLSNSIPWWIMMAIPIMHVLMTVALLKWEVLCLTIVGSSHTIHSASFFLECHINVECAICFGSMKYLNKYIDKGGDCGILSIHDHNDEVKQYIDSCYFSASEVLKYVRFRALTSTWLPVTNTHLVQYFSLLLPPFFSFYPFLLLCIYFLCWIRSTLSRFHYVDWEYVPLYLSFIATYLHYLRSYISYERSVSPVSIESFPLRWLRLYFLRNEAAWRIFQFEMHGK